MPLSEARLNRQLRRIDWRFLLPDPYPAKTICFTDGMLKEALSLVSEKVSLARRGDVITENDLAVAVNPDKATLRQAWESLRPGAACYIEWYQPTGGVRRVRRLLEKAGFEQVRAYWAWPWPFRASPLFWLPLDAPAALRHYLATRPRPVGIARRFIRKTIETSWFTGLRFGLNLPFYTLAFKPFTNLNLDDAAAISEQNLNRLISNSWTEWGFGATPVRLSWVLLTGGQRTINKVVGLVANEDGQPRLAVKLPRVAEAVPALRREARVLQAIQTSPLRTLEGIPRVLLCQEKGQSFVLGESVLSGVALSTLLRADNYREYALQAADWLPGLAWSTEKQPLAYWWAHLIEPVLEDFREAFGPVIALGQLEQSRAILTTLPALPPVCEQRDFSPWNVQLGPDNKLVVLDWESAELEGLPLLDLIYFLTYLAFYLDGAMISKNFIASYRTGLNPATFTGQVAHECLQRYINRLGIAPEAIRPLRLLVWLLHSRSEYRQFQADKRATTRPDPEILQNSLFLRLWKEELAYQVTNTTAPSI